MNEDVSTLADALRVAFDRGFVEPPPAERAQAESLLAIEVRGEPYALRLAEVAGVHVDRNVTPLPSPAPALLGVVGFRGRVIPVWDLGRILGHPAAEPPRWLIIAGSAEQPIAFAFETFVHHFRATAADIVPWSSDDPQRARICDAAVRITNAAPRPLVNARALITLVEQRFARPRGDGA